MFQLYKRSFTFFCVYKKGNILKLFFLLKDLDGLFFCCPFKLLFKFFFILLLQVLIFFVTILIWKVYKFVNLFKKKKKKKWNDSDRKTPQPFYIVNPFPRTASKRSESDKTQYFTSTTLRGEIFSTMASVASVSFVFFYCNSNSIKINISNKKLFVCM